MEFIKKNWYWLIPLAAAIAGAWYIYHVQKGNSASNSSVSAENLNKTVVLYNGIPGYKNEVMYLQKYLNANGGSLTVDGLFGNATASELYKQKSVWQISIKDLN